MVILFLFAFFHGAQKLRADNGLEKVRKHEPKMRFIENEKVKVGVDLNLGGAITWISRAGAEVNLVNSFDFGRQIQMSYYAGPVPFTVDGKSPKKHWDFIGWNPIQSGDAFGNPSKILSFQSPHKDELNLRCIPMHWPLENVPGECTYDSRLKLDGIAIDGRFKIINNRPDKTLYPPRHQELPAVYTNGPWYRLMTCTSDKPFTGAPLTHIEKKKVEPGPWSRWNATESWAALVDEDGFGLGVWCPGVCDFSGGFAGKPGKGGPADNPTGYVAPSPLELIDWNIEHEYRCVFILGTVDEIRKYVYDHADRSLPAWTFDKTRRGWTYVNATDTGFPIERDLNVKLEKPDPQLISPIGCWRAEEAGTLVIEAASRTKTTDGRLYWRGPDDKTFPPEKTLGFRLTSDGEYHACRINLADTPGWTGAITQLRFDPESSGAEGDWIRVKSIRLEK